MFLFRTVVFSILVLVVCEAVALSAVTWSFLESAQSSFQFLKTASDNRARDTIVSLAKAAEIRMNPAGFQEIQKTFARLKTVTSEDPDQFRVLEVALVNPNSILLADSNEVPLPALKNREPHPEYSGDLYTRALRMRKWQYPDPIVIGEATNPIAGNILFQYAEPFILKFFPNIRDEKGLVSSAVYHETKLDVVGAVHLIYTRGNFGLFIQKQQEMYLWMIMTYGIAAFALSVGVILVYVVFATFNRKDSQMTQRLVGSEEAEPPIIERKSVLEFDDNHEIGLNHSDQSVGNSTQTSVRPAANMGSTISAGAKKETVVNEKSTASSMEDQQPNKEFTSNPSEELKQQTEKEIVMSPPIKRDVVDAIYLGEHGS
ncbi:hypothetical protein [Leptospira sp. GIMC2001]|uniref:hypothetical protein n=1 Tax=Leptospira sp. GIMC2001 TaxID=1513297 RepID=UPI00234BE0AF|nr:hypothetical protein [Leptospira sp. GIMC2001]WCL50533.1 hypothetical protein O4O04_06855 [Leptospira sp. GIMC2001]